MPKFIDRGTSAVVDWAGIAGGVLRERSPASARLSTPWAAARRIAMLKGSTGGLKSMASGGCEARLAWDTGMMQYDFGPHHPLRPERFTYGLDLLRAADLLETEERMVQPR